MAPATSNFSSRGAITKKAGVVVLQNLYDLLQKKAIWRLTWNRVSVKFFISVSHLVRLWIRVFEHCRCFLMLAEILSIFELGDRAVQRVHKLRRVVSEHQELYKTLYGIKLGSKPKNHYAFHVVNQLSVFQMFIHTCAQERQHKIVNNKSRNSTCVLLFATACAFLLFLGTAMENTTPEPTAANAYFYGSLGCEWCR